MKILFVFNHPAPYKVDLYNLLGKDVDLDVIFERSAASDRPNEFYFSKPENFNCIYLDDKNLGKENSFSKKLKQYIKDNHSNYDLIIMNGYSTIAEIKAIRMMKKNKIDFVLQINGGIIHHECWLKRLFKISLITSAKYFLVPDQKGKEFLLNYLVDEKKIFEYTYSTIFNDQINKKVPSSSERDLIKNKYNIQDDFFVSASNFIPRKNNEELINIFSYLDETLLLIGSGPENGKYTRIVEENKKNNIKIIPFMNKHDLLEIIRCSKGFITLSNADIYGHTVNESLACGVPVISSDKVNSAHKLIKNNNNGFIVNCKNKYGIINAIKSVNESMFDNCIKTAQANTIEDTKNDLLKFFKEVSK